MPSRSEVPRRLVLLGPPGCGKGTQAGWLHEELGVPHIAPGDLLRESVEAGTPRGREAVRFMDAGELVPDELVVDLVSDRLGADDAAGGFVLDGFPRTTDQAERLEEAVGPDGLDRVVYLALPDDEVVARVGGRRSCPRGHVYHVDADPPRVEGVCDVEGEALRQRDDDTEPVLRRRLAVYHERTAPLLERYADRGLLREVDARGTPPEVEARVRAALLPSDRV